MIGDSGRKTTSTLSPGTMVYVPPDTDQTISLWSAMPETHEAELASIVDRLRPGQTAMIVHHRFSVGNVRWILLLAPNNVLGWTSMVSGLKLLPLAKDDKADMSYQERIETDEPNDDLFVIRDRSKRHFMPGQLIRVVRHRCEGVSYDQVWLHNGYDGKETASDSVVSGCRAVVISVIENGETWFLLLSDSGKIGWTTEAEGMRCC